MLSNRRRGYNLRDLATSPAGAAVFSTGVELMKRKYFSRPSRGGGGGSAFSMPNKASVMAAPAIYSGGFGNRPLRRPKRRGGLVAKYGCHGEDERFGTASQANCTYVGARSLKVVEGDYQTSTNFKAGSVYYQAAAALLRWYLYTALKVEITNQSQKMPGYGEAVNYGNWTPRKITLFFLDRDPANTSNSAEMSEQSILTYDVSNNVRKFYEIAQDMSKIIQDNVNENVVLYGMSHIHIDNTGTDNVSPILSVQNMKIKAYSTMTMTIQNCTIADGTASGDARVTNRVDANPLEGRVYYFNGQQPITHSANDKYNATDFLDNRYKLRDTNGDGILAPTASLTGDLVQYPDPSIFKNCTGYRNIVLHPGEIKRVSLPFVFNGDLNKFFYGLRRTSTGAYSGASESSETDRFGRTVLFAFEKLMNTSTDNNISIHYEVTYQSGAVVRKGERAICDKFAGGSAATVVTTDV